MTLSYGDDPTQFAELTVPEGEPKGTVVYFHGGFWRAQYDVSLGRPIAISLARHGWATLNVEYRRNDLGGGFPETFDDVDAAFALLAGTGLESGPVVAMGHSAGGHLAAWAASRDQQPETSPWSEPQVSASHLSAGQPEKTPTRKPWCCDRALANRPPLSLRVENCQVVQCIAHAR
jgi:acetyl esterase/lipase